MKFSILIYASLGFGLVALPVYAEAVQQLADSAPLPDVAALDITPSVSSKVMLSAFEQPLSNATLAQYRGGAAVVNNTNNLNGQLYDNQALDNITGSNIVTNNAFAGASGLSTVIQNSGNNVLIQNATILNLHVQ